MGPEGLGRKTSNSDPVQLECEPRGLHADMSTNIPEEAGMGHTMRIYHNKKAHFSCIFYSCHLWFLAQINLL
jgi:hypothetical protein